MGGKGRDTLLDLDVVGVVLVERLGDDPLVGGVEAAGLENSEELRVDAHLVGSVAGGLHRVHRVVGVVLHDRSMQQI